MIKVNVIALGKLKEKYLSDAVLEYQKRLSRYCDFKIIEIDPVKLPENPSEAEVNAALKKEAEIITKKIPSGSAVFPLCVEGKQCTSPQFAKKISTFQNEGKQITFIIGSSYGLCDSVKALGFKLSISEMTFPHQLFRVMLLEQIYRVFKINEGSTYHK